MIQFENITPVASIWLLSHPETTIQTCHGPLTLIQRLDLEDWAWRIETTCCLGSPMDIYRCLRCRKLCCFCFGASDSVVCDDCSAEMRDRLMEILRIFREMDGIRAMSGHSPRRSGSFESHLLWDFERVNAERLRYQTEADPDLDGPKVKAFLLGEGPAPTLDAYRNV